MFGPLQHEVHRDRQENRSRGLKPRLQVAALQRHGKIVNAGHLVRIFGRGFGEPGVRGPKHRIVNEETRNPADH